MTRSVRILAGSPLPPLARELLAELGEVVVASFEDRRALAQADVLVVRAERIDADALTRAPRLRAIARTGAGLDAIDVAAATSRGVPVIYAPEAGTGPVAEGTLALILAANKRLRELGALVATGRWDERYGYETRDIEGATLGIVGLGRIGSAVARLATAIGMRVIAHEPHLDGAGAEGSPARIVGLAQLFREADVISLHCSLTDETRGLIDRRLLSSTKPGAILVNASRGDLIADESLLCEALERGWLSAIALDVFASEPPAADHPLVADPRVICTPHAVGLTRAWNERVFGALAQDLRLLLAGERPLNVANPETLVEPVR